MRNRQADFASMFIAIMDFIAEYRACYIILTKILGSARGHLYPGEGLSSTRLSFQDLKSRGIGDECAVSSVPVIGRERKEET